MIRTRLCDLLGVEYPIIQAPMAWVAGADLAAAVSNAGALGSIGPNAGAKTITTDVVEVGERMRYQIRKMKSLTDKPFAVNFPIEAGRAFSDRCVEVALEEDVQVAITSVGNPEIYTNRLKEGGIKVLHSVSNVEFARKAEAAGVDAVIAGGYEGGGHSGLDGLTTMVLVPQVADAVNIPTIAAGGIADARGFVAAIALGADGVSIGTRFMCTSESNAHPVVKEAMLKARNTSTVSFRTPIAQGRALKNDFINKLVTLQASNASPEEMLQLFNTGLRGGLIDGDMENGQILCGAIVGMIESIVSAAEVIQAIINQLPSVLARFK